MEVRGQEGVLPVLERNFIMFGVFLVEQGENPLAVGTGLENSLVGPNCLHKGIPTLTLGIRRKNVYADRERERGMCRNVERE